MGYGQHTHSYERERDRYHEQYENPRYNRHDYRGEQQVDYGNRNRGMNGRHYPQPHSRYPVPPPRPPPAEYQRSFVGQKRGREEEQFDSRKHLIEKLMSLCDMLQDTASHEVQITEVVKLCRREFMCFVSPQVKRDFLCELLTECSIELSHKMPFYATVIGLLNADDNEFTGQLISHAHADFVACLASGGPGRDRARLLLRLFACLAVTNVLHPSSVVSLCTTIIDAAVEAAHAGADPSGLTWQPWTDHLVYMVLSTMPWAGSELAAAVPAEMALLLGRVEEYMEARPRKEDPDLRPFYGNMNPEDTVARSDSGGASFLGLLWSAVQELRDTHAWRCQCIASPHTPFESAIAAGSPHTLPETSVPQKPPGSAGEGVPTSGGAIALAAAALRQAYPPRGGIAFLEPRFTHPDRPAIDAFVVEEIVLDVVSAQDGHRVEAARIIGTFLHFPFDHLHLTAQVLFGQLLRLPCPALPPLAYATLLVDLCKLRREMAKSMSGCIREIFARVEVMDPELVSRTAQFLAYHLSCFDFMWPWDKWGRVTSAPAHHPQRRFCEEVINRIVNLSYYENVAKTLPQSFLPLLGPPPAPQCMPPVAAPPPPPQPPPLETPAPQRDDAATGDEKMADAEAETAGAASTEVVAEGREEKENENEAAAATSPKVPEVEMEETGPVTRTLENGGESKEGVEDAGAQKEEQPKPEAGTSGAEQALELVGQLVAFIRTKMRPSPGAAPEPVKAEQVLAWLEERKDSAALSSQLDEVKVLGHALLAAGAKTFSHLCVAFQRHAPTLRTLLDRLSHPSAGVMVLLEQSEAVYGQMAQKHLMTIDRLLQEGIAQPVDVANWIMGRDVISRPANGALTSTAWDMLHAVVGWALIQWEAVHRPKPPSTEHPDLQPAAFGQDTDMTPRKAPAVEERVGMEMETSSMSGAVEGAHGEASGLNDAAAAAREADATILELFTAIMSGFLRLLSDSSLGGDDVDEEQREAIHFQLQSRMVSFIRQNLVRVPQIMVKVVEETIGPSPLEDVRSAAFGVINMAQSV